MRLAAAELDVARGEEERVAAELEHADLERDARPGGRFLEDHAERLPGQLVAELRGVLLDVLRESEDRRDFVGGVVVDGDEVLVGHLNPLLCGFRGRADTAVRAGII